MFKLLEALKGNLKLVFVDELGGIVHHADSEE